MLLAHASLQLFRESHGCFLPVVNPPHLQVWFLSLYVPLLWSLTCQGAALWPLLLPEPAPNARRTKKGRAETKRGVEHAWSVARWILMRKFTQFTNADRQLNMNYLKIYMLKQHKSWCLALCCLWNSYKQYSRWNIFSSFMICQGIATGL